MREVVLSSEYVDSFELNSFAESNISDYESDILDLYEHDLKENYNWNENQSFIWPNYEVKAFESALDQFSQKPDTNTGHLNKKLNQIMRNKQNQSQADKLINDTLFKKKNVKESIQKRFQRKLNELVGIPGTFGIEVQIDPNKKYITQIVDENGNLDPMEDPLEFKSKLEAEQSEIFKKYCKKFGKNNVRVVEF